MQRCNPSYLVKVTAYICDLDHNGCSKCKRNCYIVIENTGVVPHPLLLNALQVKLGHADSLTTLRYISTALKLMGLDLNDGHIKMSLNRFKNCIKSQELVKREAKAEFGEDFDNKYFDVIKYAISREIVIDDNIIKEIDFYVSNR